jgi:ABC-type multidrug transport system fused ATPase/permease subunit
VRDKLIAILKLVGWFIWFSIGLFFIVAAAGLGAGSIVPGSSAFIGIATMFFGAMMMVFSELGKTMIGKMKIALDDLQRSFKKAADSVEDDKKK